MEQRIWRAGQLLFLPRMDENLQVSLQPHTTPIMYCTNTNVCYDVFKLVEIQIKLAG